MEDEKTVINIRRVDSGKFLASVRVGRRIYALETCDIFEAVSWVEERMRKGKRRL